MKSPGDEVWLSWLQSDKVEGGEGQEEETSEPLRPTPPEHKLRIPGGGSVCLLVTIRPLV